MRRRLFWTITIVAAATGLLVLIGSVVASQRAAREATFRELLQSSREAVAVIEEFVSREDPRPRPPGELLALLEGENLNPLFTRIRRVAGGSEISFAAVREGTEIGTDQQIFERITLDRTRLESGASQFTRSRDGELVVVTPTTVDVRGEETTVLVAVARDVPLVRLGDQLPALIVLGLGIVAVSAVMARVFSQQLASRLEPLASASRRIAEGDVSARVPQLGDEDLEPVAGAFNEMADQLEAGRDREREFLLGVGHDLRTPLTTIAGYAEALEAGGLEDPEVQRIGQVLGAQSGQIARLISDMTTLARLDQPEFDLREEWLDLGGHVGEVVAAFRPMAGERGVTLSVDLEPGIRLESDPDRVAQVAQNLIDNALRHTPETGEVVVSVHSEPGDAVLEIRDSGIGIAADDLPHVFDRHFVGRRAPLGRRGSGLGLSIVAGLARRMDATVDIQSEEGSGTTVTVRWRTPEAPVPEVGLEPTRP